MNFKFSNHVLGRLQNRGISKTIVLKIIEHPDEVTIEDKSITIYSELVEENSKSYI